MNVATIIPARMAATRFPGKPLAKILGIPMIGHCYHRAKMAKLSNHTYIATCDAAISDYIKSIGGQSVMTASSHERASDRAAEAVLHIEKEIGMSLDVVALIQGDEPLVHPDAIDEALACFSADPSIQVLNLMSKITDPNRFTDPNEVKVVFDRNFNALYFSREPIPSKKKYSKDFEAFKQLGMIFFRRDFLLKYSSMEPTPLEIIESVDMNRILEHGHSIKMYPIDFINIGVDVPADLQRAESLMANDKLLARYAYERV